MECKRVYGDLGTVYAQCGGIFGISAFVDRCMDKWMADPTLNANEAVATWHAKAQRCGFKFLVVQIIGQLTGGPQRYTGRPIDEAHKHLNISGSEWDRFMEIFNEVCEEFQLPEETVGDLSALLISMECDCVVEPGEVAPANPGPALPRGSSLYARCGGVYPIALFADRMVDALLHDERVSIPFDGQKRNDVTLKYLFTEVVCSITGGPEVITSKNDDETKLLLPKWAWEIFIATAQIAADHLPQAARAELIQCLQRSKTLIVDPTSDETARLPAQMLGPSGGQNSATVKTIQSAAAGRLLSSAAIAARHAAPGAHVDARRRVMGDPRTLYGRGGGVFGLAKLSDRLMDAWMEDPALNANAAVAKWHESQQKFGFKFLVTQLLGYLTGGPQRYTGVPMETAHKHLAITADQWQSFVADAGLVFQEFGIDANTQSDLQGILASFRDQCIVKQGEVVPPDPGMCRARPQGHLAYAQLGGVYPIALFADRLVDNVLRGDRVQVQWNAVDDPSGIRHPPGLKYMVTELLCHSAGGPEMATSRGFDDAKLGVNADQWSAFLEVAGEAATVWPTKHHREMVLKICEKSKAEICLGLEGVAMPDLEALAVMETAGSDALMSCPFSGKSGGQCPFSGQRQQVPAPSSSQPNQSCVAVTDLLTGSPRNASVVPTGNSCPMAGRILGSSLQQRLDELTNEDPDLCCPVSLMVLSNPVIASDGFIYDYSSLQSLLANGHVSPMTREALKKSHRSADEKKLEVTEFLKVRSEQLLDFAGEVYREQPHMAWTALERATEYLEGISTDQDSVALHALAKSAVGLHVDLRRPVPERMQQLIQ